jgi:hypothetical protein
MGDVIDLGERRREIVIDDLCAEWREFLTSAPRGLVEFNAWRERVRVVLARHYSIPEKEESDE